MSWGHDKTMKSLLESPNEHIENWKVNNMSQSDTLSGE